MISENLIVALGDSFTQGVGAYPLLLWESHRGNRNFNITGELYRNYQEANNWASQMVANHLPQHKAINLGVNGMGNRGITKEIYLNAIPQTTGKVTVILMLSGLQRFDFLKSNYDGGQRNKWTTIWPFADLHKGTAVHGVEEWYANHGYSAKSSIIETLLSIADMENYCKARGYSFVFANAFDPMFDMDVMKMELGADAGLLNMVNWDNFVPGNFTQYFLQQESHNHNLWSRMQELEVPSTYITPCGHWTIEGQRIVAEKLYNFVASKTID